MVPAWESPEFCFSYRFPEPDCGRNFLPDRKISGGNVIFVNCNFN